MDKKRNPLPFLKVLHQNLPLKTLLTASSSSDLVPTQSSGAAVPDVGGERRSGVLSWLPINSEKSSFDSPSPSVPR